MVLLRRLEQKVCFEFPEVKIREMLGLKQGDIMPEILPTQLVNVKKQGLAAEATATATEGATAAQLEAEAACTARVRLVARGRYQPGQEINADAVSCENISPESGDPAGGVCSVILGKTLGVPTSVPAPLF